MSNVEVNDHPVVGSSSPSGFADFQMGAAGAVISILLVLAELDFEIGALDNKLAAMNAKVSTETSMATGKLQKDQGQQQKKAQMMSGIGQISSACVSLGGTAVGEIYANRAHTSLEKGKKYLDPVDKKLGNMLSNAGEPLQKEDLKNPAVQKRLQQMKVDLDLTQSPQEVVTKLEGKEEKLSDQDIMRLTDNKDVEAIQKHAREQIDQKMGIVKTNTDKLHLITQSLQNLPQGVFNMAGAVYQAYAKDDEAQATVLQSLAGIFAGNNSLMQGKSSNEFGLIPGIAQYLQQLLMANKYN
ncbi:hypothetical protein [Simkania sp.]|uniref:hypothetical protein n=1 Tax=Simkania sp. TaxID=34094 RepID=UPI003B518AE0